MTEYPTIKPYTIRIRNAVHPDTGKPNVEVDWVRMDGQNLESILGGPINDECLTVVQRMFNSVFQLQTIGPNTLIIEDFDSIDAVKSAINETGKEYPWNKFHTLTIETVLSANGVMLIHGVILTDEDGLKQDIEEQVLLDDDTTDPYGHLHTCIGSDEDFWCFDWFTYPDGRVKVHAVINSETGSFIMDGGKEIAKDMEEAKTILKGFFDDAYNWCYQNGIMIDVDDRMVNVESLMEDIENA